MALYTLTLGREGGGKIVDHNEAIIVEICWATHYYIS